MWTWFSRRCVSLQGRPLRTLVFTKKVFTSVASPCSAESQQKTLRRASVQTPARSRPTAHPVVLVSVSMVERSALVHRSVLTSIPCWLSSHAEAARMKLPSIVLVVLWQNSVSAVFPRTFRSFRVFSTTNSSKQETSPRASSMSVHTCSQDVSRRTVEPKSSTGLLMSPSTSPTGHVRQVQTPRRNCLAST